MLMIRIRSKKKKEKFNNELKQMKLKLLIEIF
jgi:hypothetical protein